MPGIHVFASAAQEDVDGRVKPGHDDHFDNAQQAKKLRLRRASTAASSSGSAYLL
jgi:hypothetical protein